MYGKRFLHNKIAQHKTQGWDPFTHVLCNFVVRTNHNSSVYRWMMLHKHVDDTNETPLFRNGNLNPININCIGFH